MALHDQTTSTVIPPITTSSALSGNQSNRDIKAVKLMLYIVIFLISVIGNSLVCLVILRRRKMKTVTNYFILNLAIADLALTCICIPFDIPVQEMDYNWPYGAAMCKILYPLQTLTLFASVYTLTVVSLVRYWAIVHPLRGQLSITAAKRIIVVIWLVSILPVSPYIFVLGTNTQNSRCEEQWPEHALRSTYTVSLFILQYMLPLAVIAGAYFSIGKELRDHSSAKATDSPQRSTACSRFLEQLHAKETSKVLRMLKVVTAVFAFCVLPTNCVWLWLDFGSPELVLGHGHFWELVAFCNIITFANSAANPICYTILNDNYRKEFRKYIKMCFKNICRRSKSGFETEERHCAHPFDSVDENKWTNRFPLFRIRTLTTSVA